MFAVFAYTAKIIHALLVSLGILAAVVGGIAALFGIWGWFVPILPFVAVFFAVSAYMPLERYLSEKREKDAIREIFAKYVSADVTADLIQRGIESLSLGGQARNVTVFFSDLVGFTTLSETLDPETLGKVLNSYFERMTTAILAERGTIDKFIGDAIMAFWNAPLVLEDHAARACRSALEQRKALSEVRQDLLRLGVDTQIDMRIGISAGLVVVGNFGSSHRYDYTVLGDTVNVASRLESINKVYGTHIIVSASVRDSVGAYGEFVFRELDRITLKGKHHATGIYELVDRVPDALRPRFSALRRQLATDPDAPLDHLLTSEEIEYHAMLVSHLRFVARYERALRAYRTRNFSRASRLFAGISDPTSELMRRRSEEYARTPPPEDWDGVYVFLEK